MTSEIVGGGVIEHTFGGDDGPLCFTGNEFAMSTRDGVSDELLIFLQGGRGLWTDELCGCTCWNFSFQFRDSRGREPG